MTQRRNLNQTLRALVFMLEPKPKVQTVPFMFFDKKQSKKKSAEKKILSLQGARQDTGQDRQTFTKAIPLAKKKPSRDKKKKSMSQSRGESALLIVSLKE